MGPLSGCPAQQEAGPLSLSTSPVTEQVSKFITQQVSEHRPCARDGSNAVDAEEGDRPSPGADAQLGRQ